MAGQNVELNGSSSAADSLRAAISKMDFDTQTRPETPVDMVEPTSTLTKKLSLAKRISRFFGGKSSKSQGDSPSSSSTGSSTSSTPKSSDVTSKKNVSKLKKEKRFSAISRISSPTMEVISEDGKQERPQQNQDSDYAHQRSYSTPEILKPVDSSDPRRAWLEAHRDRAIRSDSGFDSESMNGQTQAPPGHRRYSSANTPAQRGPLQRRPPQSRSRQSSVTDEDSSADLLPYQQQQQQLNNQNGESRRSSLTPPSPKSNADEQRRRNTLTEGLQPPQPTASPQRRSSTPVANTPETLVSRIDRDKSTICFQHPAPRPVFLRDTNLDPALSSLVQQHRQDFKVNQRLGGTGVPPPPPSPQYPPQLHGSPVLADSTLPPVRDRDFRAPRRDSSGSQSISYSPHQHPFNTSSITPVPSAPGTPPLHPTESGSVTTAHGKRVSVQGQGQVQGQVHPYAIGHKNNFSGSDGNLLYTQSGAKISPQLQPQGLQYNSQGRQRTAPKRQSSAGYFTMPQQQQHQAYSYVQPGTVSPFPSPALGAAGTNKAMGMGIGVGTVTPEHSLALQNQQQQLQFQLQQQQLQHMQQQQQIVQQQQYLQAVSPLALLQQQQSQAQQQQQQQLEQLQQIRIHQQQLLIQQQQQLQQQLEQTRAAVAASASTSAASVAKPSEAQVPAVTSAPQDPQGVPLHFGLPAAPVLTTAMGLASMNPMNPMNPMNMNMNMNALNYPHMNMGMNLVNMGSPIMNMGMGMGPQLMMTTSQVPPVVAYTGYPSMVNGGYV
ncbi:MAG: hypothetical protein BYD32DRAFT_430191 [Podila humilis]|nr:MAG: hypothetical protein BYD32DRAFT_430191 [Podila humilis]